MNRIILIGNGFDLAHDLKTSYQNFIDWLWRKKINRIKQCDSKLYADGMIYFQRIDGKSIKENWPDGMDSYNKLVHNINADNKFHNILRELLYDNKFFKIITEKNSLQNWVDIEEEYYKLLQKIIKKSSLNDEETYANIKQLNNDFSQIKKELVGYLLEETTQGIGGSAIEFIDGAIYENIYSKFELRDFTKEGVAGLVEEKYQDYLIDCNVGGQVPLREQWEHDNDLTSIASYPTDRDYYNRKTREGEMELMPLENILFLNFNYTKTERDYSEHKDIETQTIHIHGELNNPNNPIIFGYGDEIGKEYEEIENVNDNDFLENIKSIRYSDTSNYKKPLDYIDSDKYQIFLLGHSCGLSDRTLLSTLFEHINCVSIKPFYHKKEDGTDNYSDIVRNISRHFKDKAMMREKVANKKYCKPLS